MIFEKYFRKSFYFDLREYCADLPLGASGIVIVLYCCINLFMPLCFKTLSLQLTIAPWGAFLLLMLFLYFEKSSIPIYIFNENLKSSILRKFLSLVFLLDIKTAK